jgi:hypothetical protein
MGTSAGTAIPSRDPMRARRRLAEILEPIERDLAGLSAFDVDVATGQVRPVDDAAAVAQLLEEDRQRQDLEARGRRALATQRAGGPAAAKARWQRLGDWRARARKLDAELLRADPDLAVKERAAVIAERLSLSPRTIRDHLYAHARVNVKRARKLL